LDISGPFFMLVLHNWRYRFWWCNDFIRTL